VTVVLNYSVRNALRRTWGGNRELQPVIIVNVSKYGCGALIVLLVHDPVHIPLHIMQAGVRDLSTELHTSGLTVRSKRVDVPTRELAAFLVRKLWDQIVSPIVDFLWTTHSSQSRIWWCPAAEFSVFPFHNGTSLISTSRPIPKP